MVRLGSRAEPYAFSIADAALDGTVHEVARGGESCCSFVILAEFVGA
jgi:hypothetical protein